MSRIALTILWPSFLMAGVLEALVFAFIDPRELHLEHYGVEPSPQGIYTLGFLLFWGVLSTSGAISALLLIEVDPPRDP
jgi:hypothetical protein